MPAVKLSLSKEKLVLSVNAPETGLAIEEIPVAYEGEEIEIGSMLISSRNF